MIDMAIRAVAMALGPSLVGMAVEEARALCERNQLFLVLRGEVTTRDVRHDRVHATAEGGIVTSFNGVG